MTITLHTALLIALIVLQVADAALTIKGMKSGATEANPIVRWLVGAIGRDGALLALKAAAIAALVYYIDQTPTVLLAGLAAVYAVVVVRNVRVVRALGA